MPQDTPAKSRSWRKFALVLLLHAVVLTGLLYVDEPLYASIHHHIGVMDRSKLFICHQLTGDGNWEFFESYGIWLAGLAAASVIWSLDTRRRRSIAILVAGLIVASALTSVSQKTIGRMRPSRTRGQTRLMAFGSAWTSGKSACFPSGHATFAAGLATYLALAYPRLKWFAWFMAVGCGVSRIYFRKHFPADIYGGFLMGHYGMLWTWEACRRHLAKWFVAPEDRGHEPATNSTEPTPD